MKWLFLALIALVGSVAVALVALPDPGYVLLGYGNYSIETSLLVLAVVLVLVYFALRALAGLWHVPSQYQHWGRKRYYRRLQRWFDQGTLELAEGRFERAERRLVRLLKSPGAPLQAYLSAAEAASQLNADDRRDSYLQLALKRQPNAEVSVLIRQAELQLARGQTDQTQTTLTRLQALAPRSHQTLRLRMQLYLKQKDWSSLRALLPELHHSQVLDHDSWQKLAVQVYREHVQVFASDNDIDTLNASWRQLPPPVQQDSGVFAVYIEHLVRLGAPSQGGRLLRERIADGWNPRLVYLYGEVVETDSSDQQTVAEHWLEGHPDDPILQLTLAKISLRNQLWGKARSYLEASIGIRPTREAYRLLAALLEQLDDPVAAAECYRKGLALTDGEGIQGLPLAIVDASAKQGKAARISRSV